MKDQVNLIIIIEVQQIFSTSRGFKLHSKMKRITKTTGYQSRYILLFANWTAAQLIPQKI